MVVPILDASTAALLSKETILQEARLGNEAALRVVFDWYSVQIIATVRKHLHHNDWEDGIQECLLAIMRCVDKDTKSGEKFDAFVAVSMRNSMVEFLRQKRLSNDIVENAYEPSYDRMETHELLSHLPGSQRCLVEAHFGIGGRSKSINQIAADRGMSPREVSKELREAIQTMRELGA